MHKIMLKLATTLAFLIAQPAWSADGLLLLAQDDGQSKTKQEILESLAIPNKFVPSGIQAISQVTGKYVSIDSGYAILVYQFHNDGTVHLDRGSPKNDSFNGTWRNEDEKTCFTFGAGPEYCGRVELARTEFTFVAADGQRFSGPVFEIGPPAPRMASEAKPLDGVFCDKINAIASAGADKFASLIDPNRQPEQVNEFSDPTYWSTLSFGANACTIGDGVFGPEHECFTQFQSGNTDADEAYQVAIQQMPLCLGGVLKSAEIDTQQKYESSAQLNKEGERDSEFLTQEGTKFRVSLQGRSVCSDVLTCSDAYGVWLSARLEN